MVDNSTPSDFHTALAILQTDMNTKFESLFNTLNSRITNLDAIVQSIPQVANPPSPPLSSPPTPKGLIYTSGPKTKDPDTFTGKSTNLRAYINQITFAIEVRRDQFPDDRSQILYAHSFLRGNAESWSTTTLLDPDAPTTLPTFLNELAAIFGDPDEDQSIQSDLLDLHQTGPLSVYVSEFQRLSMSQNLPDPFKITLFTRGLKPSLQYELSRLPSLPPGLKDIMHMVLRMDTRMEGTLPTYPVPRYPSPYRPRPPPTITQYPPAIPTITLPPSHSGHTPMEIGSSRPRGKLTREEYAYRKSHDLCTYCGQAGHIANSCPLRPAPRVSFNGVTTTYFPDPKNGNSQHA